MAIWQLNTHYNCRVVDNNSRIYMYIFTYAYVRACKWIWIHYHYYIFCKRCFREKSPMREFSARHVRHVFDYKDGNGRAPEVCWDKSGFWEPVKECLIAWRDIYIYVCIYICHPTLWYTNRTMENNHFFFNGQMDYKWQCSIAMLVYQKVPVLPIETHFYEELLESFKWFLRRPTTKSRKVTNDRDSTCDKLIWTHLHSIFVYTVVQ